MQSGVLERAAGLAERRLTQRVRRTWSECADGRLPSWDDVQALDIGDDWRSCFAVDLALSDPDPYFIYIGEDLARLSEVYFTGANGRHGAVIDLVAARIEEAVITRRAVSHDEQAALGDGGRIAFRCVLLPLSNNGRDVSHVFGAANGKLTGAQYS
ncbi:MAG: hypothetical protein AAFW81_02785 [Pseudomonadota bacterium]